MNSYKNINKAARVNILYFKIALMIIINQVKGPKCLKVNVFKH